MIGRKTEKLVD